MAQRKPLKLKLTTAIAQALGFKDLREARLSMEYTKVESTYYTEAVLMEAGTCCGVEEVTGIGNARDVGVLMHNLVFGHVVPEASRLVYYGVSPEVVKTLKKCGWREDTPPFRNATTGNLVHTLTFDLYAKR